MISVQYRTQERTLTLDFKFSKGMVGAIVGTCENQSEEDEVAFGDTATACELFFYYFNFIFRSLKWRKMTTAGNLNSVKSEIRIGLDFNFIDNKKKSGQICPTRLTHRVTHHQARLA